MDFSEAAFVHLAQDGEKSAGGAAEMAAAVQPEDIPPRASGRRLEEKPRLILAARGDHLWGEPRMQDHRRARAVVPGEQPGGELGGIRFRPAIAA